MSTINDGGPVYPTVPVPTEADHKREKLERLRDEFAMAALAGLLRDGIDVFGIDVTANDAYKMADAMLRARGMKP